MLDAWVTKEQYEKLPEEIKKVYVEHDGGFMLSVNDVTVNNKQYSLQDVSSLRLAHKKERSNSKAYFDQLKAYQDESGEPYDPAKVKEVMAKYDEMMNFKGDKALEAIKAENSSLKAENKKFKQDYEKNSGLISKMTSTLTKEMIDNRVNEAITNNQGNHRLLKSIIKERVKLHQGDNGEFSALVHDEFGNVEYSIEDPQKPMTIDQFVKSLKNDKEYSLAFQGTGNSGAGNVNRSGSAQSAGSKIVIKRSDQRAITANLDKLATGEAVLED